MNKIAKMIAPLFLLVAFFTACERETTQHELALCGSYSVPGMFCYDLKGDSYTCSILERDEYGRIMYDYTTVSVITGEEESAIIICQKIDTDYVYFYEDLCYDVSESAYQHTDELKAANDWGKALDSSKMSQRKNSISYDLVIDIDSTLEYQHVRSASCDVLGVSDNQVKELCVLDQDNNGHALYYFCGELGSEEKAYFVLCNQYYEISLLEIPNNQVQQSELVAFKKEHGWIYGTASIETR